MASKSLKNMKNALLGILVATMTVAFLPTSVTHSQTVVIPDCPSVDDLPKKGVMEKPDEKKKQPKAEGDTKTKKQQKS